MQEFLAGEKGFEPLHAGIKIRCLNQLGDSPTLTLSSAEREVSFDDAKLMTRK